MTEKYLKIAQSMSKFWNIDKSLLSYIWVWKSTYFLSMWLVFDKSHQHVNMNLLVPLLMLQDQYIIVYI